MLFKSEGGVLLLVGLTTKGEDVPPFNATLDMAETIKDCNPFGHAFTLLQTSLQCQHEVFSGR